MTSTSSTFSSSPSLYIVPSSSSFAQAGFISSNSSTPSGAVTTGFTFFGTDVAYAPSSSSYEMQFWAQATNTTGVWALMWNQNGTLEDNSTPVTVKSIAPAMSTT